MKEFFELTERLASEVKKAESSRKVLGEFLRKIGLERSQLSDDMLEDGIVIEVEKSKLAGIKIAGVDGGLVKKGLHGIDVILSRAVGVIFSYVDGRLERVEYHPSPIPPSIPALIFDPYSELEFEMSCGMERQALEATVAKEVIESFKPEILLMHGSIIPHLTEKPSKRSLLYPTFLRMIERYNELFQASLENGSLLAGIVEDSRGMRFCEILNEKILPKFDLGRKASILLERSRDTVLLSYVLKVGERTAAFSYSPEPESHPVLRDFGKLASSFFSFYLRTVEFDRPLRVDVLSKDVERINKLSSVLLTLAGHSSYGMPSVLIEADQRARLSEQDLELFCRSLASRIGTLPGILALRREERPF